MYSKSISSEDPVLVVLLIDQSGSMRHQWAGSDRGDSLAHGAKVAINKALYDLALHACVSETGIKDRVHVSAYEYSGDHDHQHPKEVVRWALRGLGEGRGWVEADRWVTGYDSKEEVEIDEDGGNAITMDLPIWIEEGAGGGTPMCTAFRRAADVVMQHNALFPNSHPPIVINITDGMPTDAGDDYAEPDWDEFRQAASMITSQEVDDGRALLLNVHVTSDAISAGETLVFPVSAPPGSHEIVENMLSISSILPANMVVQGKLHGHALREGAKGLILNGDRTLLTQFLKIGTTMGTDVQVPAGLLTS